MIINVANITYDWDNIKNVSQKSNTVKICTYNAILNVCIGNAEDWINIYIFNNTGMDLLCLKIRDYNNSFFYQQETFMANTFKKIKYKKIKNPKVLIIYLEKESHKYNTIYIAK